MKCDKCKSSIQDDSAYCEHCGEKVVGTKKSWLDYADLDNSKANLEKKAKSLAGALLGGSMTAVDTMKESFQSSKEKESKKLAEAIEAKYDSTVMEMLLFLFHMVDRIAFNFLEVKQREYFVDELFLETRRLLGTFYDKEESAGYVKGMFTEKYNAFQKEYGQYKFKAPEGEGMGGTLFWEFGKRMSKHLTGEEFNITLSITAPSVAMDYFKMFELAKVLGDKK